jgi:hypothetical protein
MKKSRMRRDNQAKRNSTGPTSAIHEVSDQLHLPAWKELGNLGPAVAVLDMCRQNDAILLLAPDIFADVRIQMIVPSALILERLHIQELTFTI